MGATATRLRSIGLRLGAVILIAHFVHLLWSTHDHALDTGVSLASLLHRSNASTTSFADDRRVARAWGPADESPVHWAVGVFDGHEQVVTIVQAAIRRRVRRSVRRAG